MNTVVFLVIVHLVLVLYQIQFKSMVLDSTFFRDVLMFPLALIGIVTAGNNRLIRLKLDLLVLLLVAYGIVHVLIAGYGLIEGGRVYRVFFVPLLLYYVGKNYLANSRAIIVVTNFLFISLNVYLLDAYLEFLLNYIGYSQLNIPWYSYIAKTNYRYVGAGVEGYITPGEAGVLGLQGWQHASSAVLMALYAYVVPFVFFGRIVEVKRHYYNIMPIQYTNFVLLSVLVLIAILIYSVTMQVLVFLAVMMVINRLFYNKRLKLGLRSLFVPLLVVALVTFFFVFNDLPVFQRHYLKFFLDANGIYQESTFSTIVNIGIKFNDIGFEDIYELLFGFGPKEIDILGSSENRLITYGFEFGAIWLGLYLAIIINSFLMALKIIHQNQSDDLSRFVAYGVMLFLVVCSLDSLHYFRAMSFPLIDIFAILLGMLAGIYESIFFRAPLILQ